MAALELADRLKQAQNPILPLHRYPRSSPRPRPVDCNCVSCKPKLYNRHPLAIGTLQPGRHDSWDLAVTAVSSFTAASLGFGQLHAQHCWKDWWLHSKNYHALLAASNLSQLSPQVLTKPLNTFNALFFLNHLPSAIVSIQWSFFGANSSEQGRTLIQPDGVLILLNPNHPRHRHNPTGILRTLLHELCHAFLGRYSCYGGTSCDTMECRLLCRHNYGTTGHGRAWQLLTKAIEDEAAYLLPGLSVRLGHRAMAMLEIERGGFLPSECDLRELCQDFAVVARVWMRKVVRDDDEVMDGKLNRWAGREKVVNLAKRPRRRSTACLRQGGM